MMPIDPAAPQDFRPAARDTLAAAGPVEPSPSPDLAPGPTLSGPAGKSRADYFRSRKTEALANQARKLHRRGENHSAISRAIGIAPDTARRWLHPDYDAKRRRCGVHPMAKAEGTMEDDPALPTLPFVPGITISGRYRMKPQRA
jgi:hypothetical protein